ncbi:MAG: hypothetical protein R2881_10480 [Eubacteriales bacterium]
MAKMYYESDCNLAHLKNKIVAIIGYAARAYACAEPQRERRKRHRRPLSGQQILKLAEEAGLKVYNAKDAAKLADVIMILVNDEKQAMLYTDRQDGLVEGNTLVFAHGFNIHYGQISAACQRGRRHGRAESGPGHTVRSEYQRGAGVPCLIAVYQISPAKPRKPFAYAAGIGGARAGVLETTFREETETDLFGEQAVLCGGVTGAHAGWL